VEEDDAKTSKSLEIASDIRRAVVESAGDQWGHLAKVRSHPLTSDMKNSG
jgi:hypothetical protein